MTEPVITHTKTGSSTHQDWCDQRIENENTICEAINSLNESFEDLSGAVGDIDERLTKCMVSESLANDVFKATNETIKHLNRAIDAILSRLEAVERKTQGKKQAY